MSVDKFAQLECMVHCTLRRSYCKTNIKLIKNTIQYSLHAWPVHTQHFYVSISLVLRLWSYLSQTIPHCTSPIYHNAPLYKRNVHTHVHLCYKLVIFWDISWMHCGTCGICEMWPLLHFIIPFIWRNLVVPSTRLLWHQFTHHALM